MADGATKYGPYNWRKTRVRASVYIGAIKRHLDAYIDGEDRTQDTRVRHMGAIAACAGILMDAAEGDFLVDDRPSKGPASRMLAQQDQSTGVPGHVPEGWKGPDEEGIVRYPMEEHSKVCRCQQAHLFPIWNNSRDPSNQGNEL